MIYRSSSLSRTLQIAAEFAQTLNPGAVIALEGDLGAGKTQFVRGLVQGLGGEMKAVSSPTFVLMNIYPTPRGKVYHLDAYRVGGADDLEGIGFSELLEQEGRAGFVVVEWWQRVQEIIPSTRRLVRLSATSANDRRIEIDGSVIRPI